MGQSKQSLVDEINRMEKEMSYALSHCNIKEDHLALHERVLDLPMETVREGYKWMLHEYETTFKDWRKVRNLVSEAQWSRYELMGGFENHREVVMMRKASLTLRTNLISRARPDLFKKGKVNDQLKRADRAKAGKSQKQSKASRRTQAASGVSDESDG